MATFRIGTAWRNAALAAGTALINAGGGAGLLRFRTGAVPTNVADSEAGTLLGTLTFSTTSFGTPSGGVTTANAITSDTSADNSGTCGHGRMLDSTGTPISDGDASTSGAVFNFDNNVIVAGGTIAVSAMTITQPIS